MRSLWSSCCTFWIHHVNFNKAILNSNFGFMVRGTELCHCWNFLLIYFSDHLPWDTTYTPIPANCMYYSRVSPTFFGFADWWGRGWFCASGGHFCMRTQLHLHEWRASVPAAHANGAARACLPTGRASEDVHMPACRLLWTAQFRTAHELVVGYGPRGPLYYM